MKTNRILIGILAFVLVAAIATSGYMLGYASGQTAQPAAVDCNAETESARLPRQAATNTPEEISFKWGKRYIACRADRQIHADVLASVRPSQTESLWR